MPLFLAPSPTRFDVRFTLAGIPVRVHPLFWVMGLLFGYSAGNIIHVLIWVAVVFVSILIHEMGHALTMRAYGVSAEVMLYLGGGLAIPQPERFGRRWTPVRLLPVEQILISLAGPGAGFLLAALVSLTVVLVGGRIVYEPLFGFIPSVAAILPGYNEYAYSVVGSLLWVNFFWGIVNLVPVQPLDGGNVARELLGMYDALDGERKALWLSVVAGGVMTSVGLLLMRSGYVTLLFGFLTIQNYERASGRKLNY